jgi:hypothetical protein
MFFPGYLNYSLLLFEWRDGHTKVQRNSLELATPADPVNLEKRPRKCSQAIGIDGVICLCAVEVIDDLEETAQVCVPDLKFDEKNGREGRSLPLVF